MTVAHQASQLGNYLIATNPTVGTGLLWVPAQTSFVDAAPNFYVQNNDPLKRLCLDYLQLVATAAATSATAIHYAVKVQQTARSITTNNLAAITPVNPNGGLANPSTFAVYAQNSATASALAASDGTSRLVGRGVLGGLNIAGTCLRLAFGAEDPGSFSGAADAPGCPGRRGSTTAPVIVPPGGSATLYFWLPGSTASFNPEFELAAWSV